MVAAAAAAVVVICVKFTEVRVCNAMYILLHQYHGKCLRSVSLVCHLEVITVVMKLIT